MALRTVTAVLAALLIAVQVVRNAAVQAFAGTKPDEAARVWRGHPATELGVGLTDIARASRARRPVPVSAFTQVADAARKDPLAPEPFLVRGVQAELAGNNILAERAFEAAQWRDPRSLPAAYFLADRYFRAGDMTRGLREAAAMSRLAPGGGGTAIPYLAQYAASPANWPALREFFRSAPQLYNPVMTVLASNASTVPAALALADPNKANALWMGNLIYTMVGAGDYSKARAAWSKLADGRAVPGELIHDAQFRDGNSPPPFNWQLTSSTVGLAERQHGGRLHVLFYGTDDGTLASQLLLLSPGTYKLSMSLLGDSVRAHALTWSIWCDKAPQPLASMTLDVAATRGLVFTVPTGCAAQWLKLSGSSLDLPQQVDVSVSGLILARAAPGA